MAFNFSGKKVLVTGASRGIGRGIVLGLANAGCKVYALARNKESLTSLASENSNIFPVVQDLSDWDETRATLENLETLDGLVNNAAVHFGQVPALEQTKDTLDKYINVNLLSVINCMQVVGQKMKKSEKKGSIVNITSQAAIKAFPQTLGYCVSKAGVDMVTKQFALELSPYNIRVNSVNSTLVATDMAASLKTSGNIEEVHLERTPLGRNASVEDIVGPVLYLLSDYSSMVTGTTNLVDGGIGCNITLKQ